ncbi:hypothetical protein GE09DRAFT_1074793 [Coniochaeta sp. 2T2.1]|nr:hypothetical protein GE09DRAFT_1074793 [Coniochaeta sp. 2T2.1]
MLAEAARNEAEILQMLRDEWQSQYTDKKTDAAKINKLYTDLSFHAKGLTSYSPRTGNINFEIVNLGQEYIDECCNKDHTMKDGSEGSALRITSTAAGNAGSRKSFVIDYSKIYYAIILPNYHEISDVAGPTDYEVVIVPKVCVGAGALELNGPETIAFALPNRMADEGLEGWTKPTRFAQYLAEGNTYLSILKYRLEERLCLSVAKIQDFGRTMPLYNTLRRAGASHCPATLMPVEGTRITEKTEGILYFWGCDNHLPMDHKERQHTLF